MNLLVTGDGNTPLSPDELVDLIPDLTTKEELNEFEFQNILEARQWALGKTRNNSRSPLLEEAYVRDLHRRMFDQTWRWAGTYRATEKNIGVPHYQIREALMGLLGDARYWVEHQTYEPDELAVRFHHRLVLIRPFPNGNGRHARLIADVLVQRLHRPIFSWGRADITSSGVNRKTYIDALKAADQHNIQPLLAFARWR